MSACSAMGKANALDAERQEPRNKILVELISFRIVQKRIRQKRRLLSELRLNYPPANRFALQQGQDRRHHRRRFVCVIETILDHILQVLA